MSRVSSAFRRTGRRRAAALATAGTAAVAMIAGAPLARAADTGAPADPAPQASPAQSAQPWQRYNYAPVGRDVTPQSVYRTTGTVQNASAVLNGGSTTLSGQGSSITLDFGEEVGGLVTVDFGSGSDAGQQLGVAFTESSQYVGTSSDASNGGGGPDGAIYADVTPGGSWTTPQDKLRGGFRYLTLFANSTGSIALNHVSLHISFAPNMQDLRAYDNYFYSSDPLLNRIWYAGAYTVQTNTIAPTTGRVWGPPPTGWDNSATVGVGNSVLVDGAKRDRTVWPGDLGVSVPTEYASLGDMTPTRNALTTLYDHQAPSGDMPYAGPEVNFYGSDTYHLWSLIGTANYVQYTHDTAWLDSEWANYKRALGYSLAKVGGDGLMNVTETADWARSDQGGENIEANVLLHQALVTGAQLADLEHDSGDAATWRAAADRLDSAINSTLWDDAAGEYRDNPTSSLHPQDGNSLAVWYDVAPQDRATRISAALTTNWNTYGATTPEHDGQIATFPGSMELQAHLQAGDTATALELMRREWGYMLNSPLGTGSTFWEGYLANGQFGYGGPYMSNAHGWATGPTSALTFYVVGIRPTTIDGGYDIAPQTGGLHNVEGSLRTPLGDIRVAWTHDLDSRTFTEQLDAPPAAVHQVEVPTFGAPVSVHVNDQLVWNGRQGFGYGAHLVGDSVVLTGLPQHATISSHALGRVPTTLDVQQTSADTAPVRAGRDVALPVTVRATGDQVVCGSVAAQVPSGWTQQPADFCLDTRDGPADQVVDVTVRPPGAASGGPQSVPLTATADDTTASTTARLLVFGNWPNGTTATASSFHAPNTYNGAPRTYDPGNAVDGDLATFWNDDTAGQFPDTLTVTAPSATTLHGVGFASIVDGVPTDFTVQTWDGTNWVDQATVTGNTSLYRWVDFTAPVSTDRVRVVVTASQTQNGNFTRIAELTP